MGVRKIILSIQDAKEACDELGYSLEDLNDIFNGTTVQKYLQEIDPPPLYLFNKNKIVEFIKNVASYEIL